MKIVMDIEEKSNFLNILKGIAIFLMLYGHCIQYMDVTGQSFWNNPTFLFIYSFHMPLFMLVSGYTFYFSFIKRDWKSLIAHKSQQMIQPILCFGIAAWYLTFGIEYMRQGNFGAVLDGNWWLSLKDTWFLWSVLANSIWMALIYKWISARSVRILGILIGFFFVSLFPNMHLNIYMYPYFVAGFWYHRYEKILEKWIKYMVVCFMLIFSVLFVFFRKEYLIYITKIWGDVYSLKTYAMINLYRWGIGFAGSALALAFTYWLTKLVGQGKIRCYLETMGKYSLQVYCLSIVFLSFYLQKLILQVQIITGELDFIQRGFGSSMLGLVLAAIYSAFLLIISKLCEKYGLGKLLFGR